ncbi:MAG: coproporphyrinogen III oxidase family protein, partial [Candidatus Sulfotelmatobacter sp.]
FFLGLRLNRGVSLREIAAKFGESTADQAQAIVAELVEDGLVEQRQDLVCLTSRGRLLSNEVFQRFILAEEVAR